MPRRQNPSQSHSDDVVTVSAEASAGNTPAPRARSHSAQKAATPAELAETLRKMIGGSSVLIAMLVQVEELEMTPQEAHDIADPAARLLSSNKWAKRLARQIHTSSDAFDLIFALALYGLRVTPAIYARLETAQHAKPRRPAQEVRQPGASAQRSDSAQRQPAGKQPAQPAEQPGLDLSAIFGAGYANASESFPLPVFNPGM